MPIATDPLSLLFIACFLFGLLFLITTALLGNFGHTGHSVGHGGGTHVHLGGHVGGSTHQMIHHINAAQRAAKVQTTPTKQSASVQNAPHQATQGGFSLVSLLNPTSIILFLLGFGFFGYVFHNITDWFIPLALLGAVIGGIVITALLLALLTRVFGDSEGETIQDVSDRVGLIGKVSMTIRPDGLGEIIYVSPGGMRKSIAARSANGQHLERDQEVVVTNYEHGIAEVDTWEHFLEQEQEQEYSANSPVSPNNDVLNKLRALLDDSPVTGSQEPQAMVQNDIQKE